MKNKKNNAAPLSAAADARTLKLRRRMENLAMAGMLIIAVSLILPVFHLSTGDWLNWLKWVYTAGAVMYLAARVTGAIRVTSGESARLKRLRRMPAWAGVAFGIGAWFWFYSESHLGAYAGPLAILQKTILFSLVGAVLQIVSSWMIYAREQKEKRGE